MPMAKATKNSPLILCVIFSSFLHLLTQQEPIPLFPKTFEISRTNITKKNKKHHDLLRTEPIQFPGIDFLKITEKPKKAATSSIPSPVNPFSSLAKNQSKESTFSPVNLMDAKSIPERNPISTISESYVPVTFHGKTETNNFSVSQKELEKRGENLQSALNRHIDNPVEIAAFFSQFIPLDIWRKLNTLSNLFKFC
jgi:hypothetical protein